MAPSCTSRPALHPPPAVATSSRHGNSCPSWTASSSGWARTSPCRSCPGSAARRRRPVPGVVWGWKNFIDEDVPMLTPAQTYQAQPVPSFVSYQCPRRRRTGTPAPRSLVADEARDRLHLVRLRGREHRHVLVDEVLPAPHHTGRLADVQGLPGPVLATLAALAVGVDEHGQLLVRGGDVLPTLDH